jgi:hypothetical protein
LRNDPTAHSSGEGQYDGRSGVHGSSIPGSGDPNSPATPGSPAPLAGLWYAGGWRSGRQPRPREGRRPPRNQRPSQLIAK